MSKFKIDENKLELCSNKQDVTSASGAFDKNSNAELDIHMPNLEAMVKLQNLTLKFISCYMIPQYKRERVS